MPRQNHVVANLLLATWLILGGIQLASAASPETIRAAIAELKAPDVAWRRIAWKSCLLEGIREAQKSKKPLMLWVFIDRPVGDQRC